MMVLSRKELLESPLVQEWLEEGRKEGSLIAGRKGILIVLRSCLKLTQTDEFASVLELVTNKERLDHLFDVALECATIDEFRAALS